MPDEEGKTFEAENGGSQNGHGFVVDGGWLAVGWQLVDSLVLTGSYAFQTATDQDDHKVINVPKHDINLRTTKDRLLIGQSTFQCITCLTQIFGNLLLAQMKMG